MKKVVVVVVTLINTGKILVVNTCSSLQVHYKFTQVHYKSATSHTSGKPLFIKGNYKNYNYHKYFLRVRGYISLL